MTPDPHQAPHGDTVQLPIYQPPSAARKKAVPWVIAASVLLGLCCWGVSSSPPTTTNRAAPPPETAPPRPAPPPLHPRRRRDRHHRLERPPATAHTDTIYPHHVGGAAEPVISPAESDRHPQHHATAGAHQLSAEASTRAHDRPAIRHLQRGQQRRLRPVLPRPRPRVRLVHRPQQGRRGVRLISPQPRRNGATDHHLCPPLRPAAPGRTRAKVVHGECGEGGEGGSVGRCRCNAPHSRDASK